MAHLIRRRSMERLELYDLDQYVRNHHQCPPPLPPPRNPLQRRSSMNPSVERYQFLCNMTRIRMDPIYAATPMFTTIPHSLYQDSHRHILGSYIRSENVKPISSEIPIQLSEPDKKQAVKEQTDEKENQTKKDEGDYVNHADIGSDNDDDDDDEEFSSGSSSSSDDNQNEEKNYDNNDEKKGIVEQIFNRDKTD